MKSTTTYGRSIANFVTVYLIYCTRMRVHNGKSAESALEPSKFRHAIALVVLCTAPSSKGLSMSTSRAVFSNRGLGRPLQLSKCRRLGFQTNQCIKSHLILRSSDGASLDQISVSNPATKNNANVVFSCWV